MNRKVQKLVAVAAALWLVGCGGSEDEKSTESSNGGNDAGGAAGAAGAAGAESSGDAGEDNQGSANDDAGAGGGGGTSETDEACLADSDPDAPALRLTAVVPTAPQPLVDIAGGTQTAVDDGSIIYLLSMSELSSGESPGSFGVGESTDTDGTYRFLDAPVEMSFSVAGESFVSVGDAEIQLIIPLPVGDDLEIPLQEAVLNGEFNTPERCSIGTLLAEGPPSEWETRAELSGLLAVDDAREITVTLSDRSFSLCAYMAYGLAGVLLDPDCSSGGSAWTNAPDATTESGDEAWRVSAEFAATAVTIE